MIAAAALTTARLDFAEPDFTEPDFTEPDFTGPAFTGLDQGCLIGPAVVGLLHQETVERPALLGRA